MHKIRLGSGMVYRFLTKGILTIKAMETLLSGKIRRPMDNFLDVKKIQ